MRPFVPLLMTVTVVAALRAAPPSKAGSEAWQLDPAPALAPGELGEWDDFMVWRPSILRVGDTWRMYYAGARLDLDGFFVGIGMATSRDGVKWQKHSQNPLLTPEGDLEDTDDLKRIDSLSVCQLADGAFLMMYIETDVGDGSRSLKLARSEDGLVWAVSENNHKSFARLSSSGRVFSPWIYTDPDSPGRVHLWYLTDSREPGFYDLMHTVSQDGVQWIEPLSQTGKQIDEAGPISHARVVPSGDFYLLYYLFDRISYRFRISRNARTWVAMGPPDFPPPPKNSIKDKDGVPAVIFSAQGARLFFDQRHEDGSRVIRSAFCPKSAYVGKNK